MLIGHILNLQEELMNLQWSLDEHYLSIKDAEPEGEVPERINAPAIASATLIALLTAVTDEGANTVVDFLRNHVDFPPGAPAPSKDPESPFLG